MGCSLGRWRAVFRSGDSIHHIGICQQKLAFFLVPCRTKRINLPIGFPVFQPNFFFYVYTELYGFSIFPTAFV